ncbi:MAG: YdcF family protein [Myxococcaceae bacterium]
MIILLALGLFVAGFVLAVDRFGQTDHARKAPIIVVLGARVLEGGTASGSLRARTDQAVALYRQGLAPLILFSGGVGDFPPAEAEVARSLAIAAGVPEAACLVETASHSTEQNARFSAPLLEARGIREAILVSDPYHLLRARQYFHQAGIPVLTSPAPLTERNLRWSERAYWTFREVVALLLHPRLLFVARPR